jgi:hypothetical protein
VQLPGPCNCTRSRQQSVGAQPPPSPGTTPLTLPLTSTPLAHSIYLLRPSSPLHDGLPVTPVRPERWPDTPSCAHSVWPGGPRACTFSHPNQTKPAKQVKPQQRTHKHAVAGMQVTGVGRPPQHSTDVYTAGMVCATGGTNCHGTVAQIAIQTRGAPRIIGAAQANTATCMCEGCRRSMLATRSTCPSH